MAYDPLGNRIPRPKPDPNQLTFNDIITDPRAPWIESRMAFFFDIERKRTAALAELGLAFSSTLSGSLFVRDYAKLVATIQAYDARQEDHKAWAIVDMHRWEDESGAK